MSSNESIKSPTGYPIEFTVALPLEECANRIRESLGKIMGMEFATMRGYIEKVDEITYEFSVYQNLKFGRKAINGRFIAVSSSSTRIEGTFLYGVTVNRVPPEREKFLMPILIISTMICGLMTPMPAGLIVMALIAAVVGLVLYTNQKRLSSPPPLREPVSELYWWFKRTLKP